MGDRPNAFLPSVVRHVRVFISSPGDVLAERLRARDVVERLGKDPAFRDRLKIDAVLYDDPDAPAPLLAHLTPQESINQGLIRPSECDIVVCILWGRMGTPLATPLKEDGTPFLSGTEWEFDDARRAERTVLLFRRTGRVPTHVDDPELESKRAQKKLVDQFFQRLGDRRYASYDDPDRFAQLLEANLRTILPAFTTADPNDRGKFLRPGSHLSAAPPEVPADYREWLKKETGSLELLGLGGAQGKSLFLRSVYVPLITSASEELVGRSIPVAEGDETREHAPLLLSALDRQSLYVPGAPGSGKSTFCSWVAWLACEGAMPQSNVAPPDEFVEAFPASLSGKLPVLVRLREIWHALPLAGSGRGFAADDFIDVLQAWLRERTVTASGIELMSFLQHGLTVLIVDGIDEVPTALANDEGEFNPRQLLIATLATLVRKWTPKGNVLLITSRFYGLTEDDIAHLGLRSAPIGQLPDKLQGLLARRWFRILKQDTEKGDRTAEDLVRDIGERRWLQGLAGNPLMLTAMCAIYSDGGRLPQDRHQLYDRIVDGVLTKRYSDTRRRDRVRFELGAIAHAMHTGEALGVHHIEPMAEVTFDEAEMALKRDRSASTQRANVLGPREAREDLLARSGLLTSRGSRQLGFNHLSIQEFLCADRIFELSLDSLGEVFLARGSSPNWRNTLSFLFARYMAAFSVATRPLALISELVDAVSDDSLGLQLVLSDCAEVLAAKGYPLEDAPRERLRGLLLQSMTGRASAKERCAAGASLGRMGDLRFDPARWFLPGEGEDRLGFLRVPAGPFVMGSDPLHDHNALPHEQPQHVVELPGFYVAKYPVTVAQFQCFLNDSGYDAVHADALRELPNRPVAWVTWHDAVAYCDWLTRKLREWPDPSGRLDQWLEETIRAGWCVTLPSEAEWEKAARGSDGPVYPWGNAFDPDCLNAYETGIDGASAVGAFPRSASPYGALDMCGNTWEWTRSLWTRDPQGLRSFGYPYSPGNSECEGRNAPDAVPRILRGGSANLSEAFVRPALRYWDLPHVRHKEVGFRVVVSRWPE